jgi:tripartite-type tricarboxylate transporter receptor subunit TctC
MSSIFRSVTVAVPVLLLLLCGQPPAIGAAAKDGDAYPTKPVRIIIATSASGGTDYAARMFGQKLTELWGQSVVLDNRPGATGMIGMDVVAHASPDGYTLLAMNVGHLMTAALSAKLSFDMMKDLAQISIIATTPVMLVVHPSVNARSIQEFIALAKSQPGKLLYASGGIGGVQHFATELFKQEAKIDLVHVPYKGTGPGMIDLLAGQVQLTMTSAPSTLPQVNTGRLRAIAVSGKTRLPAAPALPTFAESGLPVTSSVEIWYGLLAPAGMPAWIVSRIARSVAEIAKMSDVKENMARGGADPIGNSPAQFTAFYKSEREKWLQVARRAHITLDSTR